MTPSPTPDLFTPMETSETPRLTVETPPKPLQSDLPGVDVGKPANILDPGFDLTLRPMRYPVFYAMYQAAIKNTWTVDEIDFSSDIMDLQKRLTPAERHLINRLVAFFATGDTIVSNNLVLNLYQHVNAPEARMYLSRQLYEEALHVQFYLTLLDTYIPDPAERHQAFAAVQNIPSIKRKADFMFKWIDSLYTLKAVHTREDRRQFLLNLVCFASCVEGLFFFAAFAYVYFLRSKGLLNGLAAGTNWVFRDESCHINFAMEVIAVARREDPELFDDALKARIVEMVREAIDVEMAFAQDVLCLGVAGLSPTDMRTYLQFVADQRLQALDIPPLFNVRNPFSFMDLQDVQELANFFERRVSAYQVGVTGDVSFGEEF
jgi:ribonucleoside-diphosphate reductase beta chain